MKTYTREQVLKIAEYAYISGMQYERNVINNFISNTRSKKHLFSFNELDKTDLLEAYLPMKKNKAEKNIKVSGFSKDEVKSYTEDSGEGYEIY